MTASYRQRTTCRLCDSSRLELALPLPPTPVADNYVSEKQRNEKQEAFPLDIHLCLDCGHLQLLTVVNPDLLFRDYLYVTSSSLGLVEHFKSYAEDVISRYRPDAGALVVEIGSNDGSLLRFFQKAGLKALGVDPARDIAKRATESGVETWPEFFDSSVARRIRAERGAAQIVTANNVFAHADDLAGVACGIAELLSDDGIFVFEVAYLLDFVEKTLFDTIYHEHLSYHALRPLASFLQRNGLQLIDARRIQTKAGSLRVVAQRAGGPRPVRSSIGDLFALEDKARLGHIATYRRIAARLNEVKKEIQRCVRECRDQNKKVAAYGASPSSTTLIHYLGLGDSLDFIADDNPLKKNRYSPGYHIPVLPSEALYERNPSLVILLAWTYADPILKKHTKFLAQGGRFLIPLPEAKMVTSLPS